jgi:hyaluronoglucosaminidase
MSRVCTGFCRRGSSAVIGAAVLLVGFGARAEDPSYTIHTALTGAFAETIDFGDAPVRHDVVMFYEHTLGLFPRIDLQSGAYINGGLPHLADYNAHMARCLNDILGAIPDPEWDGYAVIDYESWTPWWGDTTRRYREATVADLRRGNPEWTDDELGSNAERIYELHARRILEGTIQLGRALRPKARWGYWAYPKGRHANVEGTQWLWDACDAFYPSVYMLNYLVPESETPGLGEQRYSTYIESAFNGNLGYARQIAGEAKPVLAFAWPRYGSLNENQWLRLRLLEPHHLQIMLFGPYFWNADGVIVWDNIPQPGLADVFQSYVTGTMAPVIEHIHDYVVEQDRLAEEQRVPEDVNNDGDVDTADLSYVIQHFGTDDALADINGDGIVDSIDLTLVRQAFTG